MKLLPLAAILLTASVCAHAVTATSGTATRRDQFSGEFHFVSTYFDFRSGPGFGNPGALCGPIPPGTVVNPSAFVAGLNIHGGSGWIDGTFYPALSYEHLQGTGSGFSLIAPAFSYTRQNVPVAPRQFFGLISTDSTRNSPFFTVAIAAVNSFSSLPLKGASVTMLV